MELAALRHRLLDGSLTGMARVVLAIPIYLVLMPFLLRTLGPDLFGIWSLATIAIGAMSLTDVGLKSSLVYFVAKAQARPEEINRYFNVAFWGYAAIALAALVATPTLSGVIVRDVLHVPEVFQREALFVLLVTVAGFGLRVVALTFQAVMEGNQDLYHSNLVSLGWLIFNAVGTMIALTVRPDVYSLGLVSFAANLLVLVWSFRLVAREFPFIRVNLGVISVDDIRTMVRFGVGTQLATFAITLREPLYKILIVRTYGLAGVAVFEIVYRLSTQIVSLVVTPLIGVFGASALLSRNEQDLSHVLKPFIGYTFATLVPCVLFFQSFSEPLVGFWLGSDILGVGVLLPSVLGAFAVYYATEALYRALQGAGFVFYSAAVQIGGVAANVGTFVWLVPHQTWSVPLSLLAGFALFSAANYVMFRRRFPWISVLRPIQGLALVIPVFGYFLAHMVAAPELRPVVFFWYLGVHLVCAKYAGLFDPVRLARGVISAYRRHAYS